MPSRTQITRHDCVEGWSCIGKWKGVPLGHVLENVGMQAKARYVVFRCADALEQFSICVNVAASVSELVDDAMKPPPVR